MQSYEDRIRHARSGFSPSFIRLADYLLDSYAQTALLTATELAHTLDIDPATVVRFAQRLGYPGYPQLQREIRQKVRNELLDRPTLDTSSNAAFIDTALADVCHSMELTRRSFPVKVAEELIDALDMSERIILLAEGLALPPAYTLAAWLSSAGYIINPASGGPADMARAIAVARPNDLALAIDVSSETSFVARALSEANAAGIKTVALVAAPSSNVAQYADLVLSAFVHPEPAMRQVLIEGMIYALIQMLRQTRPGRFVQNAEYVAQLCQRISTGDTR